MKPLVVVIFVRRAGVLGGAVVVGCEEGGR